jgi:FtsH-binding integral membrane protein
MHQEPTKTFKAVFAVCFFGAILGGVFLLHLSLRPNQHPIWSGIFVCAVMGFALIGLIYRYRKDGN